MASYLLRPQLLCQLLLLLWPRFISASIVTHLPGFHGPLPFHLEAGYVGVDEVQFFYYFIESEGNPAQDPLLLWLSGGPGCSSFYALAFQNGPLKFRNVKHNGSLPTLVYHPFSWTKVSNMIFLDSPVGTGYSFSNTPQTCINGDVTSSLRVHKFIRKWLIDHPKFLSNPLYVCGDSYAGKVVPFITHLISQGIESGVQPILNLKGYLLGNPFTGEVIDVNARVPYAHNMGIISDEIYKVMHFSSKLYNIKKPINFVTVFSIINGTIMYVLTKILKSFLELIIMKVRTFLFSQSTTLFCKGEDYENPTKALCAKKLQVVEKYFDEIDMFHILAPKCPLASLKPKNLSGQRRFLKDVPPLKCKSYGYYLSGIWANDDVVRDALHIQKGAVPKWIRCNHNLPYIKDLPSNVKYQHKLTSRGYRALVYSGDHDLAVPHIGTQTWIRSLNYSIIDDWRSWFSGGQVAGYTRTYANNLTFATIKGAGHTAPEYKPRESLAMVKRWLSNQPL